MVKLAYPTDDCPVINRAAKQAIRRLYPERHQYLKADVGLIDHVDPQYVQTDMFRNVQSVFSAKLMTTLDAINELFGSTTVFQAAEGVSKKWVMRQAFRPSDFTTPWGCLPEAIC